MPQRRINLGVTLQKADMCRVWLLNNSIHTGLRTGVELKYRIKVGSLLYFKMPVQWFALIDWIFKKMIYYTESSTLQWVYKRFGTSVLFKVNICKFKDKISNNINELLWIYAHLPKVPIRKLDLLLPLDPLLNKASQVFWASRELSLLLPDPPVLAQDYASTPFPG